MLILETLEWLLSFCMQGLSTTVRNKELQDKLLHGAFAQNPLFAQYQFFAQLLSQQQHIDPQFGHEHGLMGANAAGLANALGGAGGNGPSFNAGEAGIYHQQLANGGELEGGQGVANMEGLQQVGLVLVVRSSSFKHVREYQSWKLPLCSDL